MGSPPAPLSLPLEVLLLLSVPLLSDGLPWLLADGDGKPPELLLLPEAPELLEELELEEGDEDEEGDDDEDEDEDEDEEDEGVEGEGGVGTEGVVGVLALGHPASNHVAANTIAKRGNARSPAFAALVLTDTAALLKFFIAITHVPLFGAFVMSCGVSQAAYQYSRLHISTECCTFWVPSDYRNYVFLHV